MTIQERVQEVFNRFNVKLTVSEDKSTELAEAALENGTVIYTDAEAFEEGAEAYIINDEGERIALPPGDYPLAEGGTIVVGEGGVITSVGQAEEVVEEVEASEEVTEEVEASEEVSEETEEVQAEEEPSFVTKAEVAEMIQAALESLNKDDKEEMSAVNPEAPKAEKVEEKVEEVEDEVAVELASVKAELEAIKKQAAEAGLKHQAPTQKREPLNLKNLSTQERVSALLQNFSK
jgi:predicted DNA binding CopG/RHH family protein